MVTDTTTDYIDLAEAQAHFNTSRRSIYRMVDAGLLKVYRRRGNRRSFVRVDEAQKAFTYFVSRSSRQGA